MSMQNLAIVFGPTLFGQHTVVVNGQGGAIADTTFQNQVRYWLSKIMILKNKFTDRFEWISLGNRNYS